MNKAIDIKLHAAAALPVMLGAAAAPANAHAADKGIPAMVNPAVDLAAHTPGPEASWNDSIYFTSRVKSDNGHDLGLLVHTMTVPQGFGRVLAFSVTDETTGWYRNYQVGVSMTDSSWSTTELNITEPGLKWTGNAQEMSVSLNVPWGSLDVVLESKGPALNYGGTGVFSLLGDTNYEFALPAMKTTGTLTIEGKSQAVVGQSWLDREWGPIPQLAAGRWTWMNLTMPDGDALAIWNPVGGTAENSWVTVLRRDGSYEVAAVEPLANGADEFWTSPVTGQRYPTRWHINIPALRTYLTMHVTGTSNQELASNLGGRMEATATFAGIYHGVIRVTGKNYVEMTGNWQP